jgi:hypothetical protein
LDCGGLWHTLYGDSRHSYYSWRCRGETNERRIRRIGSRCRTLRWIDSSRKWAICSTPTSQKEKEKKRKKKNPNFMCHDVFLDGLRRVTNGA